MALPSGRSRFHQLDKLVEQRCHIMGAWAGFRVTLEAVGRLVGAANALQGAVKQRLVGGFHIGRQGCFVYRKAVVLAGDHHRALGNVLHRVVGTMVTVAHFHGLGTAGQGQELVTKADAEYRNLGFQHFLDGLDSVVARLGVARAVGQEDTVRVHGQHFRSRGLRRHHGDVATTGSKHAQDVELYAVVPGDNLELRSRLFTVAIGDVPFGLAPLIGFLAGHFLGQVHTFQAREGLGQFQCTLGGGILAGNDGAVLGTFVTQDTGQSAGVDVRNANNVVASQVVIQALLVTPAAGDQRQVTNDQAGGVDAVGFYVFVVHTGVADVRIRQGDDLAGVGRVGQDFLIAGHGSVEHYLAAGFSVCADGGAVEEASV